MLPFLRPPPTTMITQRTRNFSALPPPPRTEFGMVSLGDIGVRCVDYAGAGRVYKSHFLKLIFILKEGVATYT